MVDTRFPFRISCQICNFRLIPTAISNYRIPDRRSGQWQAAQMQQRPASVVNGIDGLGWLLLGRRFLNQFRCARHRLMDNGQ
jgi:hypothetical protein